jgi:Cu/Zn superoxide dismutase
MKRALISVVAAMVAVAAWPALADQTNSVTVPIQAQNGSNQTGVATLTPTSDGKTKVDIAIKGEPDGAVEPAHIHKGPCKTLNPKPTYPLTAVTGGKSSSVVDAPLSQLQAGTMAINVHESAAAIQNYVACGDIPAAASTGGASAPTPASSGM